MDRDDILYTTRWYAKKIKQSENFEQAKFFANSLEEFVTEELGENNKPEIKDPGKKTVRLCLVIGHEENKPGAALHGGGSEYTYNSKVALLAKEYAQEVLSDRLQVYTVFRDGVGIKGAYEVVKNISPDACIELHFNAFNKKVSGSEVLYHDNKDVKPELEYNFAKHILETIYKVFNRSTRRAMRGEKDISPGQAGFYNLTRTHRFPCILVEPFFGDNPDESALAREKQKEYAIALCEAVVSFFKV